MTRTSARAKKSKQDVNKKKEEAKQHENQTDSEGAGESTDKENDSTNYDVEKITHTRIFKGKRQYLVRWKGYTEDSDTWENESTLQSCKEVLESFKKEHLTEENSDDEIADDTEEKEKPKGKKLAKHLKKNTKKSGKPSKQKKENEESEMGTEEEPQEEETKVKEKNKEIEETIKETEVLDAHTEKTSTKKGNKGKKRKLAKETESSKAKKQKNVESDDESVTDGKDYEVEKILEVHTRKDGNREFLIRWKGYRPSDDTWEPEAHLDCQELIEKFMEKVDKAKEVTKKELRVRTETKRFVPANPRRTTSRNSGLRPCYQESAYED